MKHSDFAIGTEFYTGSGKWRCTDIGTRVIVCMKIDPIEIIHAKIDGVEEHITLSYAEANADGWFNGPPYAVGEEAFDEYDMDGCTLDPKEWDVGEQGAL